MFFQHFTAYRRRRLQAGFSFTELIVVCVLLTILASVTFPVARYTARRQKEIELAQSLRKMRNAIDEYKRYYDAQLLNPLDIGNDALSDGYPEELEVLVEGVELSGQIDKKKRFLRRIPVDPMTGEAEWGLRSAADDFDSDSWGGEDVFDVYSLSEAVGLNGIPYSEW